MATKNNKTITDAECNQCLTDTKIEVSRIVDVARISITNMESEHTQSIVKREEKDNEFYKQRELLHKEALEFQQEQANDFYDQQREKIGLIIREAIKDMTSTIRWFLSVVLIIVGGIAAITITNMLSLATKANTKDVLSLKDAYTIRTLGDKYYDQRYLLRPGETIDKYTYEWQMKTVFEDLSRGIKVKELKPLMKP